MRATLRILAGGLMILLATGASVADEGWKKEKDQDGIQVYTRQVEGWGMKEMRGHGTLSARLSSLVAVINDVPATPQLNDSVTTAEIKSRESDTRYQLYSTMNAPWPVSNRDVLNQREITQDKDSLTVTITDVATKDVMPVRKGYTRIDRARQQWTLKPRSDGSVDVEIRTLSDPGGSVPSALVNATSVSLPFKLIKMLKELSQQPKYAQASLPFIKEPAHP